MLYYKVIGKIPFVNGILEYKLSGVLKMLVEHLLDKGIEDKQADFIRIF